MGRTTESLKCLADAIVNLADTVNRNTKSILDHIESIVDNGNIVHGIKVIQDDTAYSVD